MRKEKEDYIKQFRLSDHLNNDLIRCLTMFRFDAQRELFVQDSELMFLYWLVSGSVQVNHIHDNGKLAVLAIVKPLSIIGDLEIFSFETIKRNVVAVEDSTLLGIETSFVKKYGYNDPIFLHFIIEHLSKKLYKIGILSTGTVQPLVYRIAMYLLDVCDEDTNSSVLPLRSHLASLLSTTPRHLTRVIKQLEDENVIEVRGKNVTILDRKKLASYC